MVTLLSKLFIKNRDDIKNLQVRTAYGVICGGLGIFLNILIAILKIVAGSIASSIAIISDAINNLSDAGSSIIVLFGFKISNTAPDREHPYGHGRVEYIAGFLVSVLIVFMGGELLKSSIEKIIHPEIPEISMVTIVILTFSIIVKVYMFMYNKLTAKKIESKAMEATAADSISDVAATSVVLLCTVIGSYFNIAIDGWCGIAVSLLIFKAGITSAKETVGPLLGTPPEQGLVDEIEKIVLAHQEILGIHDLVVHNYGPGRVFISLHAEVSSKGDLLELHEIMDTTEHELKTMLHCEAVLHMDPICTDDKETNDLKDDVRTVIGAIDKFITFHDFRIVKGPTRTNLIFDIVVPFGYRISDAELTERIQNEIKKTHPECVCVIDVDKDFVKQNERTEKDK